LNGGRERHPSSPSASDYAFKLRLDKTPRQSERLKGLVMRSLRRSRKKKKAKNPNPIKVVLNIQ